MIYKNVFRNVYKSFFIFLFFLFLYTKHTIKMSFSMSRMDIAAHASQIVLTLASVGLLIACFVVNNRAINAAKSDNMQEMKTHLTMLRNLMWGFYAIYLINYFMHVYNPVKGMLNGSNQFSTIALIATTALVIGATHLNNTCGSDSCDKKSAMASLESLNIILSVFVVVDVGTAVISMFGGEKRQFGLTRELMEMLKSAPARSRRSSEPSYYF